ncbi:MAG: ABC transporter permease [Christensenellaceae bacterium]|jgi:putative ABC transport system permease protein
MILQSLKMAFSSIKQNKMRAFLTMLGIIIGVMAVVVLVSITSSTTSSVTDEFQSMGTNQLNVLIMNTRTQKYTMNDLQALVDESNYVQAAAAQISQSSTAKAGDVSESMSVVGTTPAYMEINNLEVASGRFIMTPDVNNNTNVAVLGAEAAEDLFGTTNVVGETVSLDGRSFLIVGVLADAGSSITGSVNSNIIIPYTVAQRMYSVSGVSSFTAISDSSDTVDMAEAEITNALTEKFGEDSFNVMNQSSMLESLDSITNTMSLMLGGIAAISLLVGGIGIMNIMLVSVTERTREIGIRKAIGAGRRRILSQFLIEALVLSVMGGLIGIGASWLLLTVLSAVLDATYTMSVGVALLATGFTLVIGLVFGISPANKAAKMPPIQALRTE